MQIFTYHHSSRTIKDSYLEPLLYVQWLHHFKELKQHHTILPLSLYIPYIKKPDMIIDNFSVISPSSVYCPCFVHPIAGEPRFPQNCMEPLASLKAPVPATKILFLNVAITLGAEEFSQEILSLHSRGHNFTPPDYSTWAPINGIG